MWTQESVNYTRTFEFPCNRLWELPQERSLWKLAWILKAELLTSNANSSTSTLSENYVFNTWDPVQARETPYMSLLEAVGATKDLSQKERLQMTPCWEERMQTKNFWDTHKAPCEALAGRHSGLTLIPLINCHSVMDPSSSGTCEKLLFVLLHWLLKKSLSA